MIEKHWASWHPEAEMPLLTSRFSTRKKRLVWTLWLLHAKLSWHCYLLWSRMFVKSPTDIMQRTQRLTFLASGFQLHAPLPLCLWGLWLRSPRVWNGEGTPFSSGLLTCEVPSIRRKSAPPDEASQCLELPAHSLGSHFLQSDTDRRDVHIL